MNRGKHRDKMAKHIREMRAADRNVEAGEPVERAMSDSELLDMIQDHGRDYVRPTVKVGRRHRQVRRA
jgi:hypothetical protein